MSLTQRVKVTRTGMALGLLLFAGGVAGQTDAVPLSGQVAESSRLTLAEVIDATWQRNPTQQLLDARLNEADTIRRRAGTLFADDPAVQVRHNTGQVGNVDGLREWEWGVEMPLWLPGQRDARRNVAEQRTQSVAASEQALRLEIAGQVRELLWTIRANQNRTLLAHKAWRTAQDLQSDIARRFEAGELARLDLVLARQETLDRRDGWLRARAVLQQNHDRYFILTGLKQIPAAFEEQQSSAREVESDHPALADAMAMVAAEQAVRNRVLTERRGNPTVMIGTRHERPVSGADYENTLGVTVRLPFGLPSYSAARVAEAETSIAQASTQRDLLKRELDIKLRQLRNRLSAVREALDLAQEQAGLARENLALTRRAFDLGEVDLFDLLRVQAQAFNAELNFRQTAIELHSNIAGYNQAVGLLP